MSFYLFKHSFEMRPQRLFRALFDFQVGNFWRNGAQQRLKSRVERMRKLPNWIPSQGPPRAKTSSSFQTWKWAVHFANFLGNLLLQGIFCCSKCSDAKVFTYHQSLSYTVHQVRFDFQITDAVRTFERSAEAKDWFFFFSIFQLFRCCSLLSKSK